MNKRFWPLIAIALLPACSDQQDGGSAKALVAEIEPGRTDAPQFGFREELVQPDPFGAREPGARSLTVDVDRPEGSSASQDADRADPAEQQQIAYSYGFGFRIAGDRIAQLQQAHTALCEAMGPDCRVLRISQAKSDWDGFGEVELQVAANLGGAFDKALSGPAEKLGGELISSVRDGEDLSENIIDTEARLQARRLLRDKLTAILRNHNGSAAELIKAEQAIADVNEEIDATQSKLERYRNRIRFSDVRIEYQPRFGESQLGFSRPVMTALRSIGTTLGTTIAVLIYGLTALVPVTLLVLALRWILHRFGLRIRFWRADRGRGERS